MILKIHRSMPVVVTLLTLTFSVHLLGCNSTSKTYSEGARKTMVRSDFKPGEITKLCEEAIETTRGRLNQLSKENPLLDFEKITADFADITAPLTFMGYVSTDGEISKEASDCEPKVSQFAVDIYTRKDLYQAIKNQKPETLPTPANQRLLSETLNTFEQNGLKLSDEKLDQVRNLKKKLAVLESEFGTRLNQESSSVEFTAAELTGVPKDFLDSLPKTADGRYSVGTKEPLYARVMDNAVQAETRRRMLSAYENRAATENTKALEEGIELRREIASIMGYDTWADYRVHDRMAKKASSVLDFLNTLKRKLVLRNQEDLAKLLKFKKETDPSATTLNPWDIRYFSYQLKKRDFNLDDEKIREYLPADTVFKGLFEVYSKLLGVQYREVQEKTWFEAAKLYEIQDSKTQEVIGYFYTDFLPRKGKYGHAAAFTLRAGRLLDNGKYSPPISAIVANFSTSEPGKPILLKHDEVRTLFHEFGHIMHQTLTRAPYASLSGSNVDHDFVEAPSQMLENWVYSEEVLSLISGHYQDPSKKLPKELLTKIIEARDFNQGYVYTRQLLFGLLDMEFHSGSTKNPDTAKIYTRLHEELFGIPAIENSHFPASFGHLMGGYDAGYYGYLWSEVYAADLFTRFKSEGILNSEVGALYRKAILEAGKMEDSSQIVEKFLGRKMSFDAFYQKLHIR